MILAVCGRKAQRAGERKQVGPGQKNTLVRDSVTVAGTGRAEQAVVGMAGDKVREEMRYE